MSRRESVGRLAARSQSASGPPTQQMVSVAVLPPRLPLGMAPPTGVGAADTFSWEESINWQHNEPIAKEENVSKGKAILRKAGLTTQRQRKNPDLPPFVLRQVPYNVWRKHYAKDKDGFYHGTHAPAEDCLLKPEDVKKWRLGDPVTKGDQWTRGREALPVYDEVKEEGRVPEYSVDYDGPPSEEPVLPDDNDNLASRDENLDAGYSAVPAQASAAESRKQTIADGKTAQDIIAEHEARKKEGKLKLSWKQKIQKGAEYAMMGTNA